MNGPGLFGRPGSGMSRFRFHRGTSRTGNMGLFMKGCCNNKTRPVRKLKGDSSQVFPANWPPHSGVALEKLCRRFFETRFQGAALGVGFAV